MGGATDEVLDASSKEAEQHRHHFFDHYDQVSVYVIALQETASILVITAVNICFKLS